ncbi:hypothetical protein [Andreprevotia chitinilytica]|uniref:hypothetical protein n=1 Tax=Andreprevotia chitinilytica TaxID=396808 RepID=UPI0005582E7D|nr:hypothetical protein [Andreprevotia chitinilytica]
MAELHRCPTPPKLTVSDFNDIADIGLDRIAQLGSVFRAIVGIAEPESDLHALARVGVFLSEEWHFGLDTTRYETVQRLGVTPPANRIADRR